MKTLTTGTMLVLLAVVLGANAVPSVLADHPTVTVDMPKGTGGSTECAATNECFIPDEISIDVGSEVVWVNSDDMLHFVTAGDLKVDPNTVGVDYPNGFDSGLVNAGEEFSHKFETAGTYPYFCTVHPWMTGIVYVEAADPPEDHHEDGMAIESLDDILLLVDHGDAVQGSPLELTVSFTGHDGNALEHVNYDIKATQGDEVLLDEMGQHTHTGSNTHTTSDLVTDASDEMPVDITVNLLGFGAGEISGPSGQLATVQVVPEFGAIAVMVLGIAIVSIIALTAKSRVIPRL